MKKLLLGLIAIFLVVGSAQAQDGKKSYSKAKKAFGIYNLDPSGNKAKLKEAREEIDLAIADSGNEILSESKTWQQRGEIYGEIATQIVAIRQLQIGDPAELPQVEDPAGVSYEAYSKALELAEKKYETKDALRGLRATQSNLYNLGIFMYEDKSYDGAYSNFSSIIAIHKILKSKGEESSLDEEDDYNNQLYIAGLAALNAGKAADAKDFFEELYTKKFDKPAIYEALYKIHQEDDIDKAYTYLDGGRKAFPDDVSLLFAEINHFLRINKLDELISKLEIAIEKEPDNISLYSTLGNVYDNLYQKEQEAGNVAEATEYFNKALKNYNSALAKEPKFFDAIYSVGALYYNKAAAMTQELNVLADDYSKEGIKKYDAKKLEIFAQFDEALPFFKKAENLDPNDINTLIALKEIFARKDQLDISEEFKTRLDTVQGGGTNSAPYFKE